MFTHLRLPRDSDFEDAPTQQSGLGSTKSKTRKRNEEDEGRPSVVKARTEAPRANRTDARRPPAAPKEVWGPPADDELDGYEQRLLEGDINFFELAPRQYVAEVRNVLHDNHRVRDCQRHSAEN